MSLDLDEILRLAHSKDSGGLLVSNTIPALVAEVKRLREDNAALVASKGDDWQTGYDTGCAMSHSIGCGAAQDHRDSLLAAVERVRELHQHLTDEQGIEYCEWCDDNGADYGHELPLWPCPTIRALDGAS